MRSTIFTILAATLLSGCMNGNAFKAVSVGGSANSASTAGGLRLQVVSPTRFVDLSGTVTITLAATPLGQLKTISYSINGLAAEAIRATPIAVAVKMESYNTQEVSVHFNAVDTSNKAVTLTVVLKKPTIDDPPPPGSGGGAPSIDPECMTNSAFDACIFQKNPVAQNKAALTRALRRGDDMSKLQTYGVKLENLITPSSLSSRSIRIGISSGNKAQPTNGAWKYPYASDSKGFVAQLMAYYWLTLEEKSFEALTGVFYAKGYSIAVDALDTSVQDNAYWDGEQIVMGIAKMSGSHEMAMSAEVYMHEMGHANLSYGAKGDIYNDANGNGNACRTDQGCIYGINEGQADFHFMLLFPDSTALGETWVNSINGLTSRNVKYNLNKTVSEIYTSSNGEIHAMGAAYAAILYGIYTDPKMNRADFGKLFSLHLQKLTADSRFPDARDIFLADDAAFFGGKYASVITQHFESRGVL